MIRERKPKLFYGYIVVAAGFLIMAMMWGSLYTFGVFFESLLTEFGWTRATTSVAISVAFFIVGPFSMVTGKLTDRFGPRKVITICGLLIGLGHLLLSQVHSLWQLYLFYGLLGIAVSGAFVPIASTVARWFVKRRGLMTGVAVSGLGAGTLVIPLLATWLIASYGWRNSYVIVGIGALVLITLAAQLLRHDPRQVGMLPYGEDESNGDGYSLAGGFSFLEAFRTRQFWILAAIWFLFCLSIGAVIAHIVLYGTDAGLSPTKAAVVLSFVGGFSTVGRIFMGSTGDRIGFRRTLIISFALISADLFWVLVAKELWMLYLFGAVYGFSYGGVAALFSPFIAEQFGLRSHGVILGVLMIASEIGEAISPIVTGYIFDVTGNYFLAFLLWAILTIGALVLLLILTPTKKLGDSSLPRR